MNLTPQIKKVVFLDRDGTIIKNIPYLADPLKIKIKKEVIPGLQKLQKAGYHLIIITNQSGIGRGLIKPREFLAVQNKLYSLFAEHNIFFNDFFYCPHHPTEGKSKYKKDCNCRKPKSGMLLQALKKYQLNPKNCYFIGDSIVDILAGKKAGIPSILIINPENKDKEVVIPQQKTLKAKTILEAVNNFILNK